MVNYFGVQLLAEGYSSKYWVCPPMAFSAATNLQPGTGKERCHMKSANTCLWVFTTTRHKYEAAYLLISGPSSD
ncbi:hypothetical protein K2173_023538 [Erythroxylum novogranatense]|uniref:Uncharacterized protein n=1 Tax=Erythroxylum novogranatense TaxID=1862640 RepID=A0AAV8TRD0_9ROSI|nr:hypothetical protein K2173_023538 [Erythroxylum novogranatense]